MCTAAHTGFGLFLLVAIRSAMGTAIAQASTSTHPLALLAASRILLFVLALLVVGIANGPPEEVLATAALEVCEEYDIPHIRSKFRPN